MKTSQIELARKWGVGKSIISRYCSRGMPLTSEWDAERWVSVNVRTNKINFRALERREAKPVSMLKPESDFDDDGEDEFEPQPKNLFDPCPDLPLVTPIDRVKKYICWALWHRGCPRDTAEWMGSYLVDLIKSGKGDEPEDELLKVERRSRRKSKAKPKHEKVPAKG